MKPIFSYAGNKYKEANYIKSLMPNNWNRIVEPFGGSAAFSFALETTHALIGDVRENNIITLEKFQQDGPKILEYFNSIKDYTKKELEQLFYYNRDELFGTEDPILQAQRWIVIRNLCYSGLDRINEKTGKYNVSFGFRNNMPWNGTHQHYELIQDWEFKLQDWKRTCNEVVETDFVLLDPPYYNRNSSYGGNYEDEEQIHTDIRDFMANTPAKCMIVHIDCPLYRELYKEMNIIEKDFTYNIISNDKKVKHLYITNYQNENQLF